MGLRSGTEQVLGEPLDFRTDLFSLGSVLYVMASGKTPFPATSTVAILRCIADESQASLKKAAVNIPDWFCQFVATLHSQRPVQRFDSAQQVAELLEKCLIDIPQGRIPSMPGLLSRGHQQGSSIRRRLTIFAFGIFAVAP